MARSGRRTDDRHASEDLGGALMETHAGAVLERPGAGQHFDHGVGEPGLLERARRDERLSALQVAHLDARQIDRRALTGERFVLALAVDLDAADLDAPRPGRRHQLVVGRERGPTPGCR